MCPHAAKSDLNFIGNADATGIKVEVNSTQIEHDAVKSAKKGGSIGVKVTNKARRKDKVFKLVD